MFSPAETVLASCPAVPKVWWMRARVIAAVVLTLLLLLGIGSSLVLIMVVPFLFDAPGTEDQVATWAMALAVLSAPVMCVLSIVAVWIAAIPAGRSAWWYAGLALPLLSLAAFWIAGSFRPGFF